MTTRKTNKTKSNPITITPREPLTSKARRAIETYAIHKSKAEPTAYRLIGYTLQAERMRRLALYSWLHEHGYKWDSKRQQWRHPGRERMAIELVREALNEDASEWLDNMD